MNVVGHTRGRTQELRDTNERSRTNKRSDTAVVGYSCTLRHTNGRTQMLWDTIERNPAHERWDTGFGVAVTRYLTHKRSDDVDFAFVSLVKKKQKQLFLIMIVLPRGYLGFIVKEYHFISPDVLASNCLFAVRRLPITNYP